MITKHKNWTVLFFLIGILLIAANLRAPIVIVGPVTPSIIASLHLSPFFIGLITTIPLLCFAIGSIFIPKLAYRIGLEAAMIYSVILTGVGILARVSGGATALFVGSIIMGIGITIANVLVPPFIKKYFKNHIGLMTAFYLAFINISSALAVGFSSQLSRVYDGSWRGALGFWVVLTIVTIPIWLYIYKYRIPAGSHTHKAGIQIGVWKSKLAWQISIFMGMQSVLYYVFVAWLPAILQDWGMSASRAGWMLFYVQFSQVPALFFGSLLAVKPIFQKWMIVAGSLMMMTGVLLILFWKLEFIVLACVLSGVSVGLIFSLATVFFAIRATTVEISAGLSGMAQAIGYFIAGCFPPLFGWLFQELGSWEIPLTLLFFLPIIIFLTGMPATKNTMVDV